MDLLIAFFKAWMIGFAIAAPVGPIGVLCIKKTLELGFYGTMAVGLGAASADALYGLIAATGLTALSGFLLTNTGGIKILGGILLLCIAYKEEHHKINTIIVHQLAKHTDFCKLYSEVVFLTLTNPLTIISYIGVFVSIGGASKCSICHILAIVGGIFSGALMWWIILGSMIISVRGKIPDTWLKNIRYLSAAIIGGFGIWTLLSGLTMMM